MEDQFERLLAINHHFDRKKNKLFDHLEVGYRTFILSKVLLKKYKQFKNRVLTEPQPEVPHSVKQKWNERIQEEFNIDYVRGNLPQVFTGTSVAEQERAYSQGLVEILKSTDDEMGVEYRRDFNIDQKQTRFSRQLKTPMEHKWDAIFEKEFQIDFDRNALPPEIHRLSHNEQKRVYKESLKDVLAEENDPLARQYRRDMDQNECHATPSPQKWK